MKYSKLFTLSICSLFLIMGCDLMDETANDVKDVSTCIKNTADMNGATIKNITDNDVLVDYININANIECVKDSQKVPTKVTVKKDISQDVKLIKAGQTVTIDYQKEVSDAATQAKSEGFICNTVSTDSYKVVGKCPYKQPINTNSTAAASQQTSTSNTTSTSNNLSAKPLERSGSLQAVYP